MSLFGIDPKFVRLVSAIDERYKLYEKLLEGSEPHPPGLQTLAQEFRNLKVRAWSIETGDKDAVKLIKDLKEEEARKQIEENGDLP